MLSPQKKEIAQVVQQKNKQQEAIPCEALYSLLTMTVEKATDTDNEQMLSTDSIQVQIINPNNLTR